MSQINSPDIWQSLFPYPKTDQNKYDRGYALVIGSTKLTGATRLAAEACSRIGSGLVSVIAKEKADIYRSTLAPNIMVSDLPDISLSKVSAILAGCGGIPDEYRDFIHTHDDVVRVFDANAIPHEQNWIYLNDKSILTPHEGEFEAIYGEIKSREKAALNAAEKTGAIIVLKGAHTVIASPKGQLVINENASPYLAKAGTGDVLAGMITGLAAQGMPTYEATCAAVWMHGEASRQIGLGLIPEDIIERLASIMQKTFT